MSQKKSDSRVQWSDDPVIIPIPARTAPQAVSRGPGRRHRSSSSSWCSEKTCLFMVCGGVLWLAACMFAAHFLHDFVHPPDGKAHLTGGQSLLDFQRSKTLEARLRETQQTALRWKQQADNATQELGTLLRVNRRLRMELERNGVSTDVKPEEAKDGRRTSEDLLNDEYVRRSKKSSHELRHKKTAREVGHLSQFEADERPVDVKAIQSRPGFRDNGAGAPADDPNAFHQNKRRQKSAWFAEIFVGIAAYRDSVCHETIWQMLSRAVNPRRLSFGIFQQSNQTADKDCLDFLWICKRSHEFEDLADSAPLPFNTVYEPADATAGHARLVCDIAKHRMQIGRIDYRQAEGPCLARHNAQMMLGDQDFYLQVDSHSLFAGGWDLELMRNWLMTNKTNSILTTYPKMHDILTPALAKLPADRTDDDRRSLESLNAWKKTTTKHIPGSLSSHGPFPGVTWDVDLCYVPGKISSVCSGTFLAEDASFMMKFNAAAFLDNPMTGPVRTPFWAAGFSFIPAQAVKQVMYDYLVPYLFDGEEYSYTARLWTHGWDFYTPFTDVVFHIYENGKHPKFWQVNWNYRYPFRTKAEQRIRHVLGLPPIRNAVPDLTDIDRYTVGKARTLEQFFRVTRTHPGDHVAASNCDDVAAGVWPYKRVSKRPDGFEE